MSRTIALAASDGQEILVPVRESARARRLTLKIDPALGGPLLVCPDYVATSDVEDFARRNLGWLESRLAKMPDRVVFEDGARVPILGRDHVISHRPKARGPVRRVDLNAISESVGLTPFDAETNPPMLVVTGQEAHVPRRITDWLKAEARRELAARTRTYAAAVGRKAGRISIRDTRSRWGSCSSNGDISYSWRLILAPERVLDYVAAHESAHIVEMNHSRRFWRLVEDVFGASEWERGWLKRHGASLHRYG